MPDDTYLCLAKHINPMKETMQTEERKTPLTKEEIWRRMKEHKRKKEELIRQMEEYLKAEYKKRTGQEPESIEVW